MNGDKEFFEKFIQQKLEENEHIEKVHAEDRIVRQKEREERCLRPIMDNDNLMIKMAESFRALYALETDEKFIQAIKGKYIALWLTEYMDKNIVIDRYKYLKKQIKKEKFWRNRMIVVYSKALSLIVILCISFLSNRVMEVFFKEKELSLNDQFGLYQTILIVIILLTGLLDDFIKERRDYYKNEKPNNLNYLQVERRELENFALKNLDDVKSVEDLGSKYAKPLRILIKKIYIVVNKYGDKYKKKIPKKIKW